MPTQIPTPEEKLADVPAATLPDVAERLEALSRIMGIEDRPRFDLERRLILSIRAGIDRLLTPALAAISFL